MVKKRISKIVGRVSDEIVAKYKLYDYRNVEIIQSLDLYVHIAKHIPEFESVDSYNHTMSSISEILADPYFVYYEPKKNSLLYFKELSENICVVVQLNLRKNKDTYIATVYPISKYKIQKYIEKSYILNR